MNYARYVAGRFNSPHTEDLEQVAYLALIKAVDGFDPEYGTTFLAYLTPMVTGELKRYFRDTTWDVHVPRRMQELSLRVRGAGDELALTLGRSPTVAELADALDATREDVVEALEAGSAYTTASLDRPSIADDAESSPLGELLGDDDPGFHIVTERETLRPLLASLPDRDKRILLMRFFRNMTQIEISEELGVSQMQVSRLLARILGQLRQGAADQ
jgi:RNA polymerase sigma-B factor